MLHSPTVGSERAYLVSGLVAELRRTTALSLPSAMPGTSQRKQRSLPILPKPLPVNENGMPWLGRGRGCGRIEPSLLYGSAVGTVVAWDVATRLEVVVYERATVGSPMADWAAAHGRQQPSSSPLKSASGGHVSRACERGREVPSGGRVSVDVREAARSADGSGTCVVAATGLGAVKSFRGHSHSQPVHASVVPVFRVR